MTWTPPVILGVGQLADADWMNTYLSDNLTFLHNPPCCRVTNSTTQSVANDTRFTLAFNQESDDTDGMHSTSVNNSRITFQTAGVYLGGFTRLSFAANATGRRWGRLAGTVIETTGKNQPCIDLVGTVGAAGNSVDLSAAASIVADVSDYQTCEVNQTSGGSLNVGNDVVHFAHWIGGPL